jgi:deoxyribodipyrimidine photolyase
MEKKGQKKEMNNKWARELGKRSQIFYDVVIKNWKKTHLSCNFEQKLLQIHWESNFWNHAIHLTKFYWMPPVC